MLHSLFSKKSVNLQCKKRGWIWLLATTGKNAKNHFFFGRFAVILSIVIYISKIAARFVCSGLVVS